MNHATLITSFLVCVLVAVAAPVAAQGTITTDSLVIGGPGAIGCQPGGDPPPLTGGIPAEATVDFVYDNAGFLTIVVVNTSPVTTGVENPVITSLYLNLPQQPLMGLQLIGQTAASGATPVFTTTLDFDQLDGADQIPVNCLGDFGMQLERTGSGPSGGIANAAADTLSGSGHSLGAVTFDFIVISDNLESLTASAFARAFSQGASLALSNAAAKFQGGGPGGNESGVLANGADCEASGWIRGVPALGNTIFVAQVGKPGCSGCILFSFNQGPPFTVGSLVIPLGTPVEVFTSAVQPGSGLLLSPIDIPNIPAIAGFIVYFCVVLGEPPFAQANISISDQFQFTILP